MKSKGAAALRRSAEKGAKLSGKKKGNLNKKDILLES